MISNSMQTVKLSEIFYTNRVNYSKGLSWDYINYLDTGNITKGEIHNIEMINVFETKIPSRAKRIAQENDIIFSLVRPNQRHYGLIKNPVKNLVVSTGFIVLTPKTNQISSNYIYHYLTQNHIVEKLHKIAEDNASTYPSLRPSHIESLELNIPDILTQKKIAKILDSLVEKIELNNKTNKTLDELAQTIFKSWFIDFVPFGEDEFIELENGNIPKKWEVKKLRDVCKIQKGLSYKGKHLKNLGIPMINLGCVEPGGDFRSNKLKYYDGEFKSQHTVTPGDIVIANTDMTSDRVILGSPIIVPEFEFSTIIFTHHLFAFKNLRISREYLYYFLKSETFRKRAEGYANGTTVLSLSKEDILSIDFLVPDDQTLEKFTNIVGNIIKLKQNNDNENLKLEKIRDSLLPKLLSGEIRVPIMEMSHEEVR